MAKTNNQKFEELYKEFNSWAKEHFPKMKTMEYLEGNYALAPYANQLEYYRRVRNLLTHDGMIGNTPARKMICVTKDMLREFQTLVDYIEQPILRKAVKGDDIYFQCLDDCVLVAGQYMAQRGYTHIPILDNGVVVGLFGENSLFEIVCSGMVIDDNTTFRDIMDFIAIENTFGDRVNRLAEFVPETATIAECKHKFSRALEKKYRLDIVFITSNGLSSGELLGLVTIWDLPGMEKEDDTTSDEVWDMSLSTN